MQLSRRARMPGAPKRGFIRTGTDIVRKETPLALYKGLGAVLTGIVPKMAIRFTSFEAYKRALADKSTGVVSAKATFLGMLPLALHPRRFPWTCCSCYFVSGPGLSSTSSKLRLSRPVSDTGVFPQWQPSDTRPIDNGQEANACQPASPRA